MRASPSAVLFVEHVDEGSLGGDSNTLALIQEGLSARVLTPPTCITLPWSEHYHTSVELEQ